MVPVVANMMHCISAADGARRDWNNRSLSQPAVNPPAIPVTQPQKPQFCVTTGTPSGVSLANSKYQFRMPSRSTPEVSSTTPIIRMMGLLRIFQINWK